MKKNEACLSLPDFIYGLTTIVEQNECDTERVAEAERLVNSFIRSTSWLPQEKMEPAADGYARHSLYCDPHGRFEIIILVWQPGQKTPLHDHDGTWGVEGVVSGRLRVTNFLQVEEQIGKTVELRRTGVMIVNEQSTGQLLPPADCHILEAYGDETVITLHIYGKQLNKFRVFEPLDDADLYVARDHYTSYTTE